MAVIEPSAAVAYTWGLLASGAAARWGFTLLCMHTHQLKRNFRADMLREDRRERDRRRAAKVQRDNARPVKSRAPGARLKVKAPSQDQVAAAMIRQQQQVADAMRNYQEACRSVADAGRAMNESRHKLVTSDRGVVVMLPEVLEEDLERLKELARELADRKGY